MTLAIISVVTCLVGIAGIVVFQALMVNQYRQIIADLTRRLDSSEAAYLRLQDSIRDKLTGGCEAHARLPMAEFLRKGGAQCPVCLMDRLDGTIPPNRIVADTDTVRSTAELAAALDSVSRPTTSESVPLPDPDEDYVSPPPKVVGVIRGVYVPKGTDGH